MKDLLFAKPKQYCKLLLILVSFLSTSQSFASWKEQGPGPILHGQSQGIPGNPVSGACNALALDLENGVTYVATVNGGIWKSCNYKAPIPNWIPLTDLKLPGLSIASLALSPINPSALFAGTGSTSAFAFQGSPGFGVVRSLDGGATWDILAENTFKDRTIVSIVPTKLSKGNVILAATFKDNGGVYRSEDFGKTFERISANGFSGLPNQGVSNLVADPGKTKRFYAGIPRKGTVTTGNEGIYRSDNGGKTWKLVNDGLTNLDNSDRILLAVHDNKELGTNAVYAMILGEGDVGIILTGIFRSTDFGETWVPMEPFPSPPIFPGGQGFVHGAIVADPKNPNVVFIAGDRQEEPFPNVNGATDFVLNAFRGDASLLPADPWQNIIADGANGTAPHADARGMIFNSDGNILFSGDGGINILNFPNDPILRVWTSINGNIRPTEFQSIAYDSLSKVIIGGCQDTGTAMQTQPNSFTWFDFFEGDGGVVAVDNDQAAHPGISYRYTSAADLEAFERSSWDASNLLLNREEVGLLIGNGPFAGDKLTKDVDSSIQTYNPYVLNKIDPSQMLFGTEYLYESINMGEDLTMLEIYSPGNFYAQQTITSLTYGGRLNGVDKPDVFYAGTTTQFGGIISSPQILHRVNKGDIVTPLKNYPGGSVSSIVMDPQNYRQIYVADTLGKIWASYDEGQTWKDLTINLPELSKDIRVLEVINSGGLGGNSTLLAGGLGGVFILKKENNHYNHFSKNVFIHPHLSEKKQSKVLRWSILSEKLPHGLVLDLHYNYKDQILAAGILGRGAWTLEYPSIRKKGVTAPVEIKIFQFSDKLFNEIKPSPIPPKAIPSADHF